MSQKETTRLIALLKDPQSIMSDVTNKLCYQLNKQLEDLFIEGLKRKGFEFKNKSELEEFIKSNCRCEDRVHIKYRVYYVNDIPFFLHCYETELNANPFTIDKEFKMIASYGSYAYL